ncbi:ribonuclease III domain-containing protein [Methanolobus sp. WCC4]|uniref:ribonuclease III family protein n=1 Tax=Methanolobus sp. WCC4 TaxID=3125784 RepID=UPI0030FAFED9
MKINEDLTVSLDQLEEFQRIIGFGFNNKSILTEALTHGSFYSGNKRKMKAFMQKNKLENADYNKLENLGDLVLDLIIGDFFYHHKETEDYAKSNGLSIEAALTAVKIVLVENEALVPVAQKLELEKYIIYGYLDNVEDIFDDVIEALIGAIYLDQGLPEAREFVYKYFDIESALEKIPHSDPIGKIQQIYGEDNIQYPLIEETGPGHCRMFTFGLEIHGSIVSTGKATQVRKAKAEAARKHLQYLKGKGSLEQG